MNYNLLINIRDKNIYNILGKIYCENINIKINNILNPYINWLAK